MPPVHNSIVDCLYTRHHDVRVRQRRLERILGLAEPWVAPFVVQLIGEYVLEILLVIRRRLLPALTDPASALAGVYGQFAAENATFVARTSARVVSYWDCNYRHRYPTFADYPGHALAAAAGTCARHVSRPPARGYGRRPVIGQLVDSPCHEVKWSPLPSAVS